MHVGQRGMRAHPSSSSSTSVPSLDVAPRAAGPVAASGMAGIGAGRSAAATSFRPYVPVDARSHYDYNENSQWSTFDSSHASDPSQPYGAISTAQSTSSFDTQSHAFDATSLPSSSSLYTSQSMQHLQDPSVESLSASASTSASANGSSSASNSRQRSISDAELLAFINDKRTRPTNSGTDTQHKASSGSGRDRTVHIKQGSDTSNTVDTLDLCHMRIERVPDALVDLIKNQIVRLALGYNHITRLPDNFAHLHSLRYLNIRANNFAHFPECVTRMPNLEILDLSRNKIRKLPQHPGRLLALRVLSMNANRLTELPLWVGKMKHLRILKLDSNPLEWPPPHISKMPNVAPPKPPSSSASTAAAEREKAKRFEDRQMLVWISKLRSWINDPANQPHSQAILFSEQSVDTAQHSAPVAAQEPTVISDLAHPAEENRVELASAPSDGFMSLQVQVPESVSDRTVRPDSEPQTPSGLSSTATIEVALTDAPAASAVLLPPLVPQPTTSGESMNAAAYRPSIDHGGQLAGVAVSQSTTDDTDAKQHARNNSHSVVQDIAATHQMEVRRSLKSKKSLPDLRKSHEDILQERRDILTDQIPEQRQASAQFQDEPSKDRGQSAATSSATEAGMSHNHGVGMQLSTRKPPLQARRMPRPSIGNAAPPLTRQAYEGAASGLTNPVVHAVAGASQGGGLRKLSLPTVGATQAAAEAAAAALAARAGYSNNTPPRFDVGHGRMASDRAENNWPSRSASPTVNGSRTAADQERNSYFRRLSTLPPSTISKAVPVPVLKFVDGTRGVLFALSQIHAAIGQFMTPVIDERISSQFHRLLDISNGSVANLINALDRFDSLSRRGTPDPSVIRGVLVTSKDSVVTFRKLVSVLQLQLRALQSSSDVRYLRTLLLMLYGSMAEVSNSWTEMAPLVEAVQPYLTQADLDASSQASSDVAVTVSGASDKVTPSSNRAGTLVQKSSSSNSSGSTPTLPSIAEASTPIRAGSRPYLARGPSRRRHAGSFSAQDLAQGAAMTPSNSNPPFNLVDLQAASAYNTPARGGRSRRQGSWGNSASSAATFAQSDSSERSAAAEGTQSTAPSTPGGSTATASQRNVFATPGAMSTPTSSRQKRSGSNASSAMDAAPLAASASATTPRSQTGTPATPAAGAGKRHAASNSTGLAGVAAATTAAGSRLHLAVADPKITVDDHLLDMVDNITKLSARVWSMLFEHLRTTGVDDKPTSTADVVAADGKEASVPQTAGDAENNRETAETDSSKEASSDNTGAKANSSEDVASIQKLRDLKELAQITDVLTSQLRSTYLRAREEEQRRSPVENEFAPTTGLDSSVADAAGTDGTYPIEGAATSIRAVAASPDNITQATVTKLFDESHQFVRAIVNTSTLIKSISVSHEFPRDLRRMLGQVAQACSNLTVYLLWLSPTSVS